jgi:hypothetical protein
MSNYDFKWKSEITRIPQTKPKQPDVWHNEEAEALKDNPNVNLYCIDPPPPINNPQRLINQAIYYVANDNPKAARKCLLAINEYTDIRRSSWDAKCWVKEEAAIQKRHPEERDKFNGKPMPSEFELVKEFWETA